MENAIKGYKVKEDILMPETPNIPKNLRNSFSNLIDLVPVPYRYEERVQKDVLLFLKLEGEEFVRDKIEQSKEAFLERAEGKSVEMKKGRIVCI
jgi:hypothetical protein